MYRRASMIATLVSLLAFCGCGGGGGGGEPPPSPTPQPTPSENAEHLRAIAAATGSESSRMALEYNSLAVGNDEQGRNLSDTHVEALTQLEAQNVTVTLADVANQLAAAGITADGVALTPEKFVEFLQAFVEVAYAMPGDPRVFLPLYLVSGADGSVPSSVPSLSAATSISPTKAGVLYALTWAVAAYPELQELSRPAQLSPQDLDVPDWLSDLGTSIFSELAQFQYPLPPDTGDPDRDLAMLMGGGVGGIVGYAICWGAASLIASTGVGAAAFPYLVPVPGNPVPMVVAGTTAYVGGQLAGFLYDLFHDEPVDQPGSVILEEDGSYAGLGLVDEATTPYDLTATGQVAGHIADLEITNTTSSPVEVTTIPGMVFDNANADEQDMVVIERVSITLAPGESATINVEGCCINLHLAAPAPEANFSLGAQERPDLLALSYAVHYTNASEWAAQDAVWLLTDDAPPWDVDAVRDLLLAAGLDPADYPALSGPLPESLSPKRAKVLVN